MSLCLFRSFAAPKTGRTGRERGVRWVRGGEGGQAVHSPLLEAASPHSFIKWSIV